MSPIPEGCDSHYDCFMEESSSGSGTGITETEDGDYEIVVNTDKLLDDMAGVAMGTVVGIVIERMIFG